ncbi:hypothetical protein HanRHA438_Chr06g0280981 [Helianthus annuus]|nr:hypothetical protein HanRHA438_Chr06g0280981 [Helianthus annuus]
MYISTLHLSNLRLHLPFCFPWPKFTNKPQTDSRLSFSSKISRFKFEYQVQVLIFFHLKPCLNLITTRLFQALRFACLCLIYGVLCLADQFATAADLRSPAPSVLLADPSCRSFDFCQGTTIPKKWNQNDSNSWKESFGLHLHPNFIFIGEVFFILIKEGCVVHLVQVFGYPLRHCDGTSLLCEILSSYSNPLPSFSFYTS